MEKKELLRFLIQTSLLIYIFLFASITSASEFTNSDNKPQLFIFVSSSMPIMLLKKYYFEASIYGGILVFKGLPEGSFEKFAKIIMKISEEFKGEAGIIIDDNSFNQFGIINVPAFVLLHNEECSEDSSCKVIYNKISGNIGVKRALEELNDAL